MGWHYEYAALVINVVVSHAAHTRTSLMRASVAGGHFCEPEFILPETRLLFERQAQRKKQILAGRFVSQPVI